MATITSASIKKNSLNKFLVFINISSRYWSMIEEKILRHVQYSTLFYTKQALCLWYTGIQITVLEKKKSKPTPPCKGARAWNIVRSDTVF